MSISLLFLFSGFDYNAYYLLINTGILSLSFDPSVIQISLNLGCIFLTLITYFVIFWVWGLTQRRRGQSSKASQGTG